MALPNEKNSRLPNWPDYALFMAVLVFCAFSARAFSKVSPQPPKKEISLSRSPASIALDQPKAERSTRTLELRCLDEIPTRIETEAGLLRMTAPSCGGKILRAINLTTGEALMLFERKNNVTTHYFPLKAGLNKILVEWKEPRKTAKTLEVNRVP